MARELEPGEALMKVGAGLMGCGCSLMMLTISIPILVIVAAVIWGMVSSSP